MTETMIIVYGTEWCGDCVRSRKVFSNNNIAYQWIDIDKDKTARQIVRNINHGNSSVPTIIFPDGCILVEPSDDELIKQLIR